MGGESRQEWCFPLPGRVLLLAALNRGGGVCLRPLAKSSRGEGAAEDPRNRWTYQSRSGREGTEGDNVLQVKPLYSALYWSVIIPSQRLLKWHKIRGGTLTRASQTIMCTQTL